MFIHRRIVWGMPKPPKMPVRGIRVGDDLWNRALERAAERGESLSDAIRKFLVRYTR